MRYEVQNEAKTFCGMRVVTSGILGSALVARSCEDDFEFSAEVVVSSDSQTWKLS